MGNRQISDFLLKPLDTTGDRSYRRIVSMDIPRAIAIGLMVIVHTFMTYGSAATMQEPMTRLLMLCGTAPGAPSFMFLMGFYVIYARPKPSSYYIKRGIALFLLGYVLNVVRFNLPISFILLTGYQPENLLPWTQALFFQDVDILQFAGLALITLGGLGPLLRRPIAVLLAIVAVALISPYLWGLSSGIPALDFFLTILWGNKFFVMFPYFPWIIWPLAGYLFGQALIAWKASTRFFRLSALTGLTILIIGIIVSHANPQFHYGDYFRAGYGGLTTMIGFVLMYVAGLELLCRRWQVRGRIRGISYLSENLTPLYMIHWTIIGWGMITGAPGRLAPGQCYIAMLIVGTLSLLVLKGYLNYRDRPFSVENLLFEKQS